MKLHLRRSGGFAGIGREWTVDADRLPAAAAAELRALVAALKPAAASSAQPDRYVYTLDVDDGTTPRRLRFGEDDGATAARLVERLIALSGR